MPITSGAYVLPDVTVVLDGGEARAHVDVEIADGVVHAIRPTDAEPAAHVVEAARGCVVNAALVDMHVHMPADNVLGLTELFLMQTLRAGITIVRDAGDTDGTATPAALAAVVSGGLPGPELHYAYGFVGAPPDRWPNSFAYDEPSQATRIVRQLAHLGARWVKSYENLDVARMKALVRAATERGLGVMGHVPYGLGHEEALLPDAQHLIGVSPPGALRRNHILDRAIDWRAVDQARLDVVRAACREHGLAVTPTLSSSLGVLDLERHDAARFEASARALPRFFADIVWHPMHGIPAYRQMGPAEFAMAREAVEKKHRLVLLIANTGHVRHDGTGLKDVREHA